MALHFWIVLLFMFLPDNRIQETGGKHVQVAICEAIQRVQVGALSKGQTNISTFIMEDKMMLSVRMFNPFTQLLLHVSCHDLKSAPFQHHLILSEIKFLHNETTVIF